MTTHLSWTPSALDNSLLVVTCEHGGYEVPPAFAPLFSAHQDLLHSHRGWDAGALEYANQLARAFAAPCFSSTTTRLLVDLNRSEGNRTLFSEITRPLEGATRQEILALHYRPYRDMVEREIAAHIASGASVLHVASHSFTAVLDGTLRNADVAWLYDPRRPTERALAGRWLGAFARRAPGLRLRRNYPYRGRSDGLTAVLRKRFPDGLYAGIELEVNQSFVTRGGTPWTSLRSALTDALADTHALGRARASP